MSTQTATCLRCGIERAVKPERGVSEMCFDCTLVERDLAAMHGTNAGYYRHLKDRTLACDPCIEAHRVAVREWTHTRGVTPRIPAQCGTASGYTAHRRRGEATCQKCKDAYAAECMLRRRRRAQRQLECTDYQEVA